MDPQKPHRISAGTGMTAGLEIWKTPTNKKKGPPSVFVLVDRSADGRFAADVNEWNAGLNAKTLKNLKDATK